MRGTPQRMLSVPARWLLLLAVTACTAAPSGVDTGSTSTLGTDPDEVTATVSDTDVQSSTTTTEPVLEFSESAVVKVMGEYAFSPDGPHPTGTVEFMEWLAFCESAFGFEKEVVAQPGQMPYLYGQVTPSQQELNFRVATACEQMAVAAGHFFAIAPTEEFGRRVFAAYVTVHECMMEHGYPVTDPPSEETFVAQWMAGGQQWHPYEASPFGGTLAVPPPDIEGGISSQASAQLELQATCPADWGTVLRGFNPSHSGDS